MFPRISKFSNLSSTASTAADRSSVNRKQNDSSNMKNLIFGDDSFSARQ